MLLHPVWQVRRDVPSPVQHQAVQPHAVVKQVFGIVVPPGLQAVVAHDHPVDHAQLAIDLAQVVHAVVVAHALGGLLGPVLLRKEMQMGIDDLHSPAPFRI